VLIVLGVAAQIAVYAQAPDSASACDAVEVSVVARARGAAAPRLIPPSLRPFDVLRSTVRRVEYQASSKETLVEHRFTLTTDQPGRFTIPSFEARSDTHVARSRPIEIVVRPTRSRGRPVVVARARIDTSPLSSLRAVAPAETVYVGQQATYEVAVFLNQTARERLRRNPTFYPPDMQAMLAYDLPTPANSRERAGSQCFDALVYRRALFPLVAGRVVIPPAQLVYSTGLSSSSLFSREESHELQTDSVTIIAVEPPADARPPEYVGAVGIVRLDSWLDSASSRVGDPMLFTVRVAGTGNVKLFPRPPVRVSWAGLVPADERVQVDSSSQRIGGSKEFDWVLTPRIAGEFDVPPVRYGYFDPSRRRYDVAEAAIRRIRVAPGSLASADTGQAEAALRIATSYGGSSWPPIHSSPVFWLAMAIAPLPALLGRARQRKIRRKAMAPPDPLKTLIEAPPSDPVLLRRQFVKALAQRLGCNSEDFTHPGALERALRRAGVSDDTAARAETLLRELDAAAYDGVTRLAAHAIRTSVSVARAVDGEALSRGELPLWIPAILVALCVGAAAAVAADPAATHFARGVSAYLREDYATAQSAFAATAVIEPSSPDAWANYGTASWAASDTAAAVHGWRQALALRPNDEESRQRLLLVRDVSPASPGWVPSLPRNIGALTFAILWLAAWSFAWIARRPHPWIGRVPLPVAVCAILIGLAAIELESRIDGSRLAVVRRAVALTSDPAIGMDRGPTLGTGEIVRIVGRRGTWTRVEASEDRDGWIPSAGLVAIADRRPAARD
jgi:hypothetical protein